MLLKNATIVDGTGNTKYVSDIRIEDNLITEIGPNLNGDGQIDCAGKVITPGFFDIHTHYDAELLNNADLTASTNAGVSHIIVGNCGVGVYPCSDLNANLIADLLEGVEDIPRYNNLSIGLKSFKEYLSYLNSKTNIRVDSFLPYSCVRSYVLGNRSQQQVILRDTEQEQITNILEEALTNGALGISISLSTRHKTSKGLISPSFYSSDQELDIILSLLSKHKKTLQYVSDLNSGEVEINNLYNKVKHLDCKVLLTLQIPNDVEYHKSLFYIWKKKFKNRIMAQIHPRANAVIYGINLPYDIRSPGTVDYSNLYQIDDDFDYEPNLSVSDICRSLHIGEQEYVLNNKHKLFYKTNFNYYHKSLSNVKQMLSDNEVLVGLTDAGAHQAKMLDSSALLWMIRHYANDFSIEYLVNKCTKHNTDFFNMDNLHTITPGAPADLNLLDLDNLVIGLPQLKNNGYLKFVQEISGLSRPNGFIKI